MTENEKMLPAHWIYSKMGEVCQTTSGGTPSRKNSSFYEGNIPWVKSGELNHNTIIETEEYISEEAIKKSSAKVFPKGTLLVALYGATIGKLAFLGIDAATNQAICAIFKNGIFESKFLYYLLYHRRQDLVKEGIGGAQPNISQTILKNLEVPICPLPEQRAIVSKIELLFSELDNGISNLKLAQTQLKVYRQAVLKKAFEGELTKKWREQQTDLPDAGDLLEEIGKEREKVGITSGKKLQKVKPLTEAELAKLPKIPKKWIWVRLDAIGELFCGQSPSIAEVNQERCGILYVTGPEQWDGSKIKETKWTEFPKRLVPEGCIFITVKGAGVGKIFPGISCAIGRDIYAFLPSSKIDFKYTIHALKHQIDVLIMKAQGDIPGLSKDHILDHYIGLCSIEEQQAIVQEIETRLSVCDKIEQDIKENLEKAEALRQSILKKAFEGKLLNERELAEVRGAEDWEPAEVLLERVRAEKTASGKKGRS